MKKRHITFCISILIGPMVHVHAATVMDYHFQDATISVCKVDVGRDLLRIFWRDETKQNFAKFLPLRAWLLKQNEDLVCATNAGIFDEQLRPLGLYIENGVTLRRLNQRKNAYGNFYMQPNGVLLIQAHRATILDTESLAARGDQIMQDVLFATQSGPMLVQSGKINPTFVINSENRLRRNAVCTISPRELVLAVARDPINFYDFALFLQNRLGCTDALYLDGNISRMFPGPDFELGPDLGPIIAVIRPSH